MTEYSDPVQTGRQKDPPEDPEIRYCVGTFERERGSRENLRLERRQEDGMIILK
jgi:hypothetical protein